jgi:hypothetical protein
VLTSLPSLAQILDASPHADPRDAHRQITPAGVVTSPSTTVTDTNKVTNRSPI